MNSAAYLLALAIVSYASACLSDSECGADECCLNTSLFIMSKRAYTGPVLGVTHGILPINQLQGTCTTRPNLGEPCNLYTCGCKTGQQCVQDQTLLSTLAKRMVIMIPGTCQVNLDV